MDILTQPDAVRNACAWFANLICDAFADRCRILAYRSVDFLNVKKRMAFLRQVETELVDGNLNRDYAWCIRAAKCITVHELRQGKQAGTSVMLCDYLRVVLSNAEGGVA